VKLAALIPRRIVRPPEACRVIFSARDMDRLARDEAGNVVIDAEGRPVIIPGDTFETRETAGRGWRWLGHVWRWRNWDAPSFWLPRDERWRFLRSPPVVAGTVLGIVAGFCAAVANDPNASTDWRWVCAGVATGAVLAFALGIAAYLRRHRDAES
jgi:hypothetical protein